MSMALHIAFIVTTLLVATTPIKATYDSQDDQIKCGGCPCNNPCYTTSPPPPPPPSPPPPKMSTPTPGLVNPCPPPPITGGGSGMAPPGYIYITGPPGDVYPVNPFFSGGSHRNLWATPRLLALLGVLVMLIVH
ncbi:hypothetical protein Hanom_Chr16g01514071 [Helianthus anomalus]